jgi:hypothetical protein
MSEDSREHSALDQAESLIRESERIRQKLTEERRALIDRVRHIDRIIAALPRPMGAASEGARKEGIGGDEISVASLVLSVVEANKEGLTAEEVIKAVQDSRPRTERKPVRAALYQLAEAKKIRRRGERGSYRYIAVAARHGGQEPAANRGQPQDSQRGEALTETAQLIAEQPDAVNSVRLAELTGLTVAAARIRLRRAHKKGLLKPGPIEGTFVADGGNA